MPAEPDQRVAALQQKAVAEMLRVARIERSRGTVEHPEHAFTAAVRHFEQHGAVAPRRIARLQHVDVRREFDQAFFAARGFVDIDDDLVGGIGGIDREISFADEAFVRPDFAERLAIEHVGTLGEFDAQQCGRGQRREEREQDETTLQQAQHA